jgi:DNA-binding protein HU-beta
LFTKNISPIFATKLWKGSTKKARHTGKRDINYPNHFINKPNLFHSFMNKTDLVNAIIAKAGLSKADAKKAVDACVEAITEGLKSGDKVSLVGFGTFSVTERPARQGINPLNKQPLSIPAKKVAKFKAGSDLDNAIN